MEKLDPVMNEAILYQSISEVIQKEDREFTKLTGQGIFYCPELYVAVVMGKAIKSREKEIFGSKVEWIRERDFGNGGPTDFAFKTADTTYAFELKLRQTHHAYSQDIEKLKGLGPGYEKYFIALVDRWEKDTGRDNRIEMIEEQHSEIYRIHDPFTSFSTEQDWYKERIACVIGVWGIEEGIS
jgi:hypothetical protein